jgi:hypothetical protein
MTGKQLWIKKNGSEQKPSMLALRAATTLIRSVPKTAAAPELQTYVRE